MEILFISPNLTMKEPGKGNVFLNACIKEIENYLFDIPVIRNLNHASSVMSKLDKDVLIIIFNDNLDKYPDEIVKLIDVAKEKKIDIWPVAINKDIRDPIDNIGIKQSYDVFEQLRCRNLNDEYLETIGIVFARKAISKVLPNFYSDNSLLFISHRRLDGEEIAAKFCDQLSIQARNNKSFRDVTNVEVGEVAQKVIDSSLSESDVLIFIHTEKSAESDWIQKELIYAVLNSIPIIWIRVDKANEEKLRIKPSDNPHIECKSEDFYDQNKLIKIIDSVLQKSFELIMLSSTSVYDRINTFEELCESSNLELIEENKRYLIYNLVSPRKGYIYPQRNINQYIQYFGRRCKEEDFTKIIKFLEDKKLNEHQLYDSAILLSDKVKVRKINENIVEDNYDDFYSTWQEYINGKAFSNDGEIIISGAFPNCDEIYKQSLYDAVNIFAKEILKNGFTLTFGSHPTFKNIIFEIGKKFRPRDYKNAINMFISKFFEKYYDISTLKMNATVTEIDVIDGNNDDERKLKSLTEMREKMISRTNVKALICLGGVIRNGDTKQGIDEEIKIARANNIPVFIVGSVGGRSSQLAAEYRKKGNWSDINKESVILNEELAINLDYRSLANKVISAIGNKK
ncbi:hypothetical protein Ccar_03535 [Clostridium carboxidivorans P7]|uniref:TIR domain-containing protein n=1 Tax=Clostridium carboxidivorans P7 TaxID=536227 RepID=C6PP63_9CLOT|nr:TIR domain-containing protein [Clostridium carboxidivorans]AKN29955.1 hypothetical protein Ccar_03535 [Clostridium carboxidivorans P7]EET88941.1 protein of unknown function DUF1863 [Clostridium carboxidivorans P7]